MNTAVVAGFLAVLAVANAGYLAAPAVTYAHAAPYGYAAPVAVSHNTGIIRHQAPLVHAYGYGAYSPVHHLVRRGLAYASPVAYAPTAVSSQYNIRHHGLTAYAAAHPVATYAAAHPIATYGAAHPVALTTGVHHLVRRGLAYAAAPVAAYHGAPVAYAAHTYAAPAVVHTRTYHGNAHPVAYAAAPAPLIYG